MALDTAADLAGFFDTDEHGQAASYDDGGGGVSVTVILDYDSAATDAGGFAVASGQPVVRIRQSEASRPVQGHAFTIDGTVYTVVSAIPDASGGVWVCRCRKSAPA